MMPFSPSDAPILLVFGQSNAHGHHLPMAPEDRIRTPLANVLGLRQPENQSYRLADAVWSPYTSDGTNLGEIQDHTYCMPNFFAKKWQERCAAAHLPDLSIIRISIGAQGVTKPYMWNPEYPQILTPGALGTVRIALFPMACQILRCAVSGFRRAGKVHRILALHWIGGEEETGAPPEELLGLEALYRRIFTGFFEAAETPFPIRFYKILSRRRSLAMGEPPENIDGINRVFHHLAGSLPGSGMISAEDFPGWDPQDPQCGIFQPDGVHYTRAVQEWFAQEAFRQITDINQPIQE